MQSMVCSGVLQPPWRSNSTSSSFWSDGNIAGIESQRAPLQRPWYLSQVVVQRAGGRGSRGRGNSNWGQDRRSSGTLSKDFGRETFGREDYGSQEEGRGRGRGRGNSNWGQDRRSSGTLSKDFGRETFRREDYGSQEEGGGRGRGRGNSNWGQDRRSSGTLSKDFGREDSGRDGSKEGRGRGRGRGSGGSYRGNGRGYRGARGSGYGTTRGRGRGGAGRYDELRRLAEKRMHDGAFEILDEETGEKVIVWGVEDADSLPTPSAEDLNWKPTTMAVAGDVSEEGWYKAMEASMAGPAGAFSVKGVRQGGVYDDDEDEDEDDEMEDMDYDDDEDEFDDDLPEEPPRVVKTVRPARLRLFGRDFKQKEVLKSEASEEVHSESSRVGSVALEFKPELSLNGVSSSVVGVDNTTAIDVERSWPPAGHLLTGSSSDVAPLHAAESNTDKEPLSDQNSLSTEEVMEQQWPPVGAMFSRDSGTASLDGHSSDETASSEARTGPLSLSTNERSRETAWKDVERVVREEDWKQGGMNPGIIDIDEDDDEDKYKSGRMAARKPQDSAQVRSNLLDELRLQTHKKLGSKFDVDDGEKLVAKGETVKSEGARSTEEDSSNVTVVKPRGFRDLKARTNYDPSLAAEFFSTKPFKDVGASEEVIAALTTLQLRKPSAIQAMAFKPILEGQSCIVADQTGSGKTLAYLAPLVQMLRAEEGKSQTKQLSKKPRFLVLVPTSELAVQVLNVCRAFSRGGAPFRSIVLTGGFKWKTQVESLAQGADVVVATPGRFLQHLEKGSLKLDDLKTVVLDEVDILYDDQEFTEVLRTLEQAASKRVQYVHVTATLPVDIHDSLLTRYPDAIPLMGPTLHRTAVGLQEVLVDCSGAEGEEKTPEKAFLSKKAVLLQLVDQRPVSKTIVFCNKIETCRDVENALARHDRSSSKLMVLPYHAALSQEARLESMQQFLESRPSKSLFLVCTDRASRGLDSFDVEHVVLFDFPRDPSEYVRRVGRTARGAGGTGKVFVFALGKQVAMARRIMARNEKGRPIHDIPGSAYET